MNVKHQQNRKKQMKNWNKNKYKQNISYLMQLKTDDGLLDAREIILFPKSYMTIIDKDEKEIKIFFEVKTKNNQTFKTTHKGTYKEKEVEYKTWYGKKKTKMVPITHEEYWETDEYKKIEKKINDIRFSYEMMLRKGKLHQKYKK